MTFRIEDGDEWIRGQMKYWRDVDESEGFDTEGVHVPQGTTGLLPYDCLREDATYPNPVLVKRFARFGLHRYNVSKGSDFRLLYLKKFNKSMNYISDYYITLAAEDPATCSVVEFQVKVGEHDYGRLNLTCFIARPQGAPKEPNNPINFEARSDLTLPYWPSDFNDTKRFHVLKESELQDCGEWIRLYLELALCTNDRWISESALSNLQIQSVAIETIEDVEQPNQMLQAKSVNYFYITFKGLAIARVGEIGEDVARKVIVRRVINELSRHWTLLGGFGFSVGEETEERPMTLPTSDEFSTPLRRPLALNLFKWKK